MRAAYVCADPGVPVFGRKGCSVHLQEVVGGLLRAGVEVHLFAARPGGDPPDGPARNATLHALPLACSSGIAARERACLEANQQLRAALTEAGGFDFVYERYSLWSFAGMEHAREGGMPGLLEVNAPLIEEQATHRGLIHRAEAQEVARRAFGAASALLAVSAELAQWLEQHPAARGRVHVVPNGVDPARFPSNRVPSRPAAASVFTVGFVGSLKPWHGVSVLGEAFALLHEAEPATRLLVVVDGPERGGLEAALARRGVAGAADLTGAVAPADIPGLLASMDVGVAPYPDLPGFYFSPLKVLEYMAAGLPVVASAIGQLRELVRDGRDGLLCRPGDATVMARALGRLAADAALRARLGSAARERAARELTWQRAVDRILGLARGQGQSGPVAALSGPMAGSQGAA